MSREKPHCQDAMAWLRTRHGREALAPLTGQDARALTAFAHLLTLYAVSDDAGRDAALVAMAATATAMQPKCRWLAQSVIPWALDWSDEAPLWAAIAERALSPGSSTHAGDF